MTDPLQIISDAIQKAAARCGQFNNIFVSVSGGSDSDVMIDLLLRVAPPEKFKFIFFDTGVEYAATKRHLDEIEKKYGIVIQREKAALPVPLGVKKYGLPFFSKDVSVKINSLQNNDFNFKDDGRRSYEELAQKYPRITSVLKWWCNLKQKDFSISKYAYLKDFIIENPPDFRVSQRCCEGAKKRPSHICEKDNQFDCKCLGLRKSEGGARASAYKNCFTFDPKAKMQNYRPIWWFTDDAKREYIKRYGVLNSDCYLRYGMTRTGCAGCPFNSNFEKDLQTLQKYEPQLYKAVLNIFGKSYDYTRKYREYKEKRKKEVGNERL